MNAVVENKPKNMKGCLGDVDPHGNVCVSRPHGIIGNRQHVYVLPEDTQGIMSLKDVLDLVNGLNKGRDHHSRYGIISPDNLTAAMQNESLRSSFTQGADQYWVREPGGVYTLPSPDNRTLENGNMGSVRLVLIKSAFGL